MAKSCRCPTCFLTALPVEAVAVFVRDNQLPAPMRHWRTTEKGDLGVLAVSYKLLELGYTPAVPVGQPRYDLLAERDGRTVRIQVKTIFGKPEADKLLVRACSILNGGRAKVYLPSEVDVLVVYWEGARRFFWVELASTPGVVGRPNFVLRIAPRRFGRKDVMSATDFEI